MRFGKIIIPDGAMVGQTDGAKVVFDDTLNYLEITGCNVGIGTATPGSILHTYTLTGVNSSVFLDTADAVGSRANYISFNFGGVQKGYVGYGSAVNSVLYLQNTASHVAIQPTGGNIGIGTTDIEAWHANYGAIEFNSSALMFGRTASDLFLMSNAYFDSGWKRKTAAVASCCALGSGGHYFYTAATGLIDSTITWTQALFVGPTGGVSIGDTTDPGDNNLYVVGTTKVAGAFGCNNVTPQTKAAHLINATDAATALTRINAILVILENYGLMATS